MELALLVYLIGLISHINILLGVSIAALLAISFGYVTFANISPDSAMEVYPEESIKYKKARKLKDNNNLILKRCVIAMLITSSLAVVIPSEKTAYTMVGAYAVQSVANDPSTKETASKVMKIINKKLDEYVDAK